MRVPVKVLMAVVLALVAGMGAPPAAGAKPKGWEPRTGGFFNTPRAESHGDRVRIENQIYDAIQHARPKSKIRISIYSLDRMRMADALIRAHRRKVSVQVLLNDHQVTRAMRKLRGVIGKKRKKRSFLYVCKHSCRSTGGKLHTKFYLFSHTGRARNVVMTGSHNLTGNAIHNQWNDLFVTSGKRVLFGELFEVFQQMRADTDTFHPFRYRAIGRSFETRVMPFPKPTVDRDPVMDILNQVQCKRVAGDGHPGRTRLRVSMHAWNGDRGVYLAEKMRRLYGAGCDVKLMYGMAGSAVRKTLRKPTARGKVPVRANGFDTDGDLLIDKYSHQKYLTIQGRWANRVVRRVYTGSSNWSDSGTRGDELILMINSRRISKRWNANFARIWRVGSRRDGSNKTTLVEPGGGRVGDQARVPSAPSQELAPEPRPGGPAWESD